MADNVELDAGSGGAVCATDDCGAAGHCQRVKLALSADGNANLITADAKGLLVQQTTAADFNATAVLAAGSALVGKVSIDQVTANANEVVVKSGTVTAVTDITNAVAVTNAGITTIAGAVAGTEMQVDVVAALPAGTNAIGKLAANSGVDIGDVDVLSIAAGDNNIGNVDIASIAAGSNLIGDVAIGPRTTGGATPYSYISDGTDFVSVTDGATTLYGISCTSTDATVVYIKFYDKATAPDPSADAASIKLRFAVPSAATGGGFVWNVPQGMDFPTGLGFALVTGAADTDETAVTANEVMVNLVYKH
jgi:hypothetical protein